MTTADTASTPASSTTPQDGFRQVSEERRELRDLRRKNRELEQRNIAGGNKFHRAGVRPATPLICEFIDQHREEFGVVPICRAMAVHGVQIAPRTYRAHRSSGRRSGRCGTPQSPKSWLAATGPDADGKRPPESLVRQPEDVGAPAAPGHRGGAAHGGTDRAPHTTERDPGSQGSTGVVWRGPKSLSGRPMGS